MWEAFNSKEQDLVRTSIDYKTNLDLNLDHVSQTEREKVLSSVMKEELKDLYSPEMEKDWEKLSKDHLNNKKAIINSIVDIAENPQKVEKSNDSNFQLLSNNLDESNETQDSTFIITPQEIADEIYGEWKIDMIEEVEFALDKTWWINWMEISVEKEELNWRMEDWSLKSFIIQKSINNSFINKGEWEYSLLIPIDYSNDISDGRSNLVQRYPEVLITWTRKECIAEIQRILREENVKYIATWIKEEPFINNGGNWESNNEGDINIWPILTNLEKWNSEIDYNKLIKKIIPEMWYDEILKLLEIVTWQNSYKIGSDNIEKIISAILKNKNIDNILFEMNIDDLLKIGYIWNNKINKNIENRLKNINNDWLLKLLQNFIGIWWKDNFILSEVKVRFNTFSSKELLNLYSIIWTKWHDEIKNLFLNLSNEIKNNILLLIKEKKYNWYVSYKDKWKPESWIIYSVTSEYLKNEAINNFKKYCIIK